jgi:phospholipid-hydroperoxide glutathione peroxidase
MLDYRDHVLLLVNVASNCEFTKENYEELPKLHDQYAKLGLKILAFPCNQFNDGETRSTKEVLEFVRTFDPTMDEKVIFFQKGLVNGARARQVYQYMSTRARNSDGTMEIRGNFST